MYIKTHMQQVHELRKMKETSRCRIYKAICHNGSYLLLFWKRKVQSSEISCA